MKSRLAILATLVLGMLLSTTGAGLAISGMSGSGDAGVAQYGPTPTPPAAPTPPPAPPTQPAQPVTPATPAPETGAVLGETQAAQPAPEEKAAPKTQAKPAKPAAAAPAAAQPTRQVEAGANELPFTGFAAIPILLGGIALLATGLVMRRRSSEDS